MDRAAVNRRLTQNALDCMDRQLARLRAWAEEPIRHPRVERPATSDHDAQWYATHRGVGHGARPGTVASARPVPVIRTVGDMV